MKTRVYVVTSLGCGIFLVVANLWCHELIVKNERRTSFTI